MDHPAGHLFGSVPVKTLLRKVGRIWILKMFKQEKEETRLDLAFLKSSLGPNQQTRYSFHFQLVRMQLRLKVHVYVHCRLLNTLTIRLKTCEAVSDTSYEPKKIIWVNMIALRDSRDPLLHCFDAMRKVVFREGQIGSEKNQDWRIEDIPENLMIAKSGPVWYLPWLFYASTPLECKSVRGILLSDNPTVKLFG